MTTPARGRIAVTGATGYIGVPRLLDAGWRVRCIARDAAKLRSRSWADHAGVEIVESDVSDLERMVTALEGCDAAYYLVHSMIAAGRAYAERDHDLARTFARAADRAGLPRIIYLGGLGETRPDLGLHLASRSRSFGTSSSGCR